MTYPNGINPFPCNPQEEAANWNEVSKLKPITRFRLTEALELMGSAAAVPLIWNGTLYAASTPAIVVHDEEPTPGAWKGLTDYEGWCVPRGESLTDHSIVWMDTKARYIRGTLSDTLCDGSAAASVTHYARGQNPGATVTVYDPNGYFKDALANCKYTALYSDRLDRYEVIEAERVALIIRCVAALDWCPTDLTVVLDGSTITNLSPYPYSYTPDPPGTATNNGAYGSVGDTVHLIRITNHTNCTYTWLVIASPKDTLVPAIVGVRVVDNLVQVQYKDFYVSDCGTTYDWQTIHTGTYCD